MRVAAAGNKDARFWFWSLSENSKKLYFFDCDDKGTRLQQDAQPQFRIF